MASLRVRSSLRRTVLTLVRLCDAGERGVRVAELTAELGVSPATVYRDLKELERTGLELDRFERDGERRIVLATSIRRPALGADERTRRALALVRDGLASMEGTFVEEVLNGLLRAPPVPRSKLRKAGPSSSVIDTVARALEKRQQLCFYYRGGRDEREEERTVEPLELRVNRDQVYLEAWCLDRDEVRTFKPARMSRARVLPHPCKKRDVDLVARRAASVRVWDGERVDVCVRIVAEKARFVSEWPLHAEQRVEVEEGGSVLVRASVAGLVEVTRWVLGWGAAAQAVEPEELRAAVRAELEGALGGYRDAVHVRKPR